MGRKRTEKKKKKKKRKKTRNIFRKFFFFFFVVVLLFSSLDKYFKVDIILILLSQFWSRAVPKFVPGYVRLYN